MSGQPVRLRLGVSEDYAAGALAGLLTELERAQPRGQPEPVVVDVEVGLTAELLERLDADRFDLVLGKQCGAVPPARGEMLWSEALVWAFAAGRPYPADGPAPVAFFPAPCAYREAALQVLPQGARAWRVALVSPSVAAVRAAALSGFAATPLVSSMMGSRLRALGPEDGLPELPPAWFVMVRSQRAQRRDSPAAWVARRIAASAREGGLLRAPDV